MTFDAGFDCDEIIKKINKLQKKKTWCLAASRIFFIIFEDDLGFERHQTVPRREGEPFLGIINTLMIILTDFVVKVQS